MEDSKLKWTKSTSFISEKTVLIVDQRHLKYQWTSDCSSCLVDTNLAMDLNPYYAENNISALPWQYQCKISITWTWSTSTLNAPCIVILCIIITVNQN
ncbi:hypothetical protein AVEN_194279-1 [Araneus ventricosus]|uniref:Uncharacterized protein n=1 Tax=Araneus ventricosus TaxID=182803 RepID=A0A4Y2G084_ARAVE|nr:hypothetical protein AVEN_194279-1 [Araneus ventricosus]